MSRRQTTAVAADRVHSAAIHLLRSVRRQDDVSGLTPARLSALSVVVYGGPLSITALAAAEQVQRPTASRLVEALEMAGYVRRSAAPSDARVVMVEATQAGREVMEAGRRRRTDGLRSVISELERSEQQSLIDAADILERVSARLIGRSRA